MTAFDLVCLDADDTLWSNEIYFRSAEARVAALLSEWIPADEFAAELLDTERANIPRYGFGAKAFVLSLLETALRVSRQQIPVATVDEILHLGKNIVDQPVELLNGVLDGIAQLSTFWPVVLITKGDLIHQDLKVQTSGIAHHFREVEIVAHKDTATYAQLFRRHGVAADRVVMIGNSVKSDILPVLELGALAIFVPHEHGWELERAQLPDHDRLFQASRFADVFTILNQINGSVHS